MLRNAALATISLLEKGSVRTSSALSQSTKGLLQRDAVTAHNLCLSTSAAAAPKLLVIHPNRKSDALLQEALRLAESYAGSDCPHIGVGPAKYFNITPSTYFGPGVVKSIQEACTAQEPAKLFVNVALSPVQQRNLESAVGLPVLDRVGLIIEIFAQRARTSEARLQVELAALDYRSSRLVRTLNSKTGERGGFGEGGTTEVVSARERGRSGSSSGGLGGASGGGQSELQLQRQRLIVRRKALQKKLSEVQRTREVQRAARRRAGKPVVAVVGYTNAGKSSLLQALTHTDAGVQDRLFATLDPALRRVHLPSGREAILSDTVGFISELPHQLVNAFRATLEEVCEADLLLHVLDASSPSVSHQREAVLQVLTDLGIPETKLQNALLEVWNKTDLIQSETPPQPASQLQIPTDIACSSSAEAGSAVPSASAEDMLHDITEPASIHSHQHHMKTHVQYAGQSHVTDEEFADNQEAAVPLNPAPESQSNAVAARQLEASADTSQPHTHSGQGQHLGSGHASLEQLHISSSDSHVADADVASRSATSQPEDMHKAQQANRASGSNQTAAGSGRSVPSNGSIQRSDGSIQHSDGSIQRTNDVSQLSSIGPQCHEGQQGSLEVATQGVDVMSDGAVQGSGKPLTLFTSTVTGEGLSQLLVEVERKLSLKWATRELADGTARLGPRLLTHTIVGPPNKQRKPRWRGAGQWESVLTQSLRDQSTTSAGVRANATSAQDIGSWARRLLSIR